MSDETCRLCAAKGTVFGSLQSDPRVFFRCETCGSVFLGRANLLSPEDEEKRYLQHRNQRTPEYEKFLNRLLAPLVQVVPPGSQGLDFGCGPVPVLSEMLTEQGFQMQNFDPFFFSNSRALEAEYDFVTCSETVEHFHEPLTGWTQLHARLRPGGRLGVMTQMRTQWEGFFDWHYPRDPTHVQFYSPRTMRWIGHKFGMEPVFFPDGVVIFQKA